MQDNIFKMARLIRQRPSISARDVAKSLGYAEPKSVYYWLGKIGFTFVTFKESVLSGIWPAGPDAFAESRRTYDGGVPVAEGFTADGTPVIGERTTDFSFPGATFALAWTGDAYGLSVAPGDWVVVGGASEVSRPIVLLLDGEGTPALARLVEEGGRPLLVEISFRRVWQPPFAALIGRVAAFVKTP